MAQIMKQIKLTITTDAPDEYSINKKKAIIKHVTLIKAEAIITFLNLVNTCIAERAGRIIILEINNDPIILIPTTIITAVKQANIILYTFVLIPIALAKLSSNVTANILLYKKIKETTTTTAIGAIMIR